MNTSQQIPATQNEAWGFWGTMNEHASAAWPLAMNAISDATQRWMGWTIGRQTSKQYGIPHGLPYLTGFVIHCEICDEMAT